MCVHVCVCVPLNLILNTIGAQLQLGHSCNWGTVAIGAQLQLGHSCNWGTVAIGAQLQLVHSCNWGTVAIGAQLQLVHSCRPVYTLTLTKAFCSALKSAISPYSMTLMTEIHLSLRSWTTGGTMWLRTHVFVCVCVCMYAAATYRYVQLVLCHLKRQVQALDVVHPIAQLKGEHTYNHRLSHLWYIRTTYYEHNTTSSIVHVQR